jgi:Protein of unknown function (DUF2934)
MGASMKPQRKSTTPNGSITQTGSPVELVEQIRIRAYELFEERGGAHGYDVEDWLRAEAEITQKAKATAA